jgi:hypothetical protein
MALRIARGLFRLWIIVSVLWICGVAAMTWWTFPRAELTDEQVGLNTRPMECDGKRTMNAFPFSRASVKILFSHTYLPHQNRIHSHSMLLIADPRSYSRL